MWHRNNFGVLLISLLLLPVHAAFIRRLDCSPSDVASVDPIFEPLSFTGYLDTKHANTTILSLTLKGNYESHNCEALGGALARMSIDARVLDRSVVTDDRLLDSSGVCPELSPIDYPRYAVHPPTGSSLNADDPGGIPERTQRTEPRTHWIMRTA